jgi:hypothetical protein
MQSMPITTTVVSEILKLALDKFFGREYLVTVLMKITKE